MCVKIEIESAGKGNGRGCVCVFRERVHKIYFLSHKFMFSNIRFCHFTNIFVNYARNIQINKYWS